MAKFGRTCRRSQVDYVEFDMKAADAPNAFCERLKSARQLRAWTQSDLAGEAGLPPSSVAHFESGSRKPSFDTLRRLANALEVTTDFLLGRTDDPALAQSADPLYRDASKLSGADRKLAAEFLKMLAARNAEGGDER